MDPRPPAPLAPVAATALGPALRPGFRAGIGALFSGLGFVAARPGTWPLALVPAVVATVLMGACGWLAIAYLPGLVASLIGPTSGLVGGVLTVLAQIAATAVAVVAGVLLGLALAQPLSGPALERIVRRAEAEAGAPAWPATSSLQDIGRSLSSVVVGLAFSLPILFVLFLIGALVPGAAVVTVPLKFVLTALTIAWDICDYPLSIRGVPVGTRVAFMKRNYRAMLGFGAGIALVALVPCSLCFVLAPGAAGAARLVLDIERFEKRGQSPT